jgi:tetratricopeptide (TPR) repeat protein
MIRTLLQIAILLLSVNIAFAQSPDPAFSHFQSGLAAQKEGKFDEALREYAAVLQLQPNNFGAHFNSGSCYAALKRWDEAITAYKAALVVRPKDPVVLVSIGHVYATLQRTN